jgi:hypothetical protein
VDTLYPSRKTVDHILKAHRDGRPIVWFLGSGISINAGFPGIQAICSYLAHLQFAISEGLFRSRHLSVEFPSSSLLLHKPSKTIELYGWPSPERLTSDMWRWLQRPIENGRTPSNQFVNSWVNYVIRKQLAVTLPNTKSERDIRNRLAKFAATVPQSQWLKTIESVVFLSELAERMDAALARQKFNGALTGMRIRKSDFDRTWIRGDWSHLLDSLTEGLSDFVDALFVSLGTGRLPSASHVLLSALSRSFGSRLALTTNFDNLIEMAMRESGNEPQVFSVSSEASVPHPILVRPRFSIVKLHGSNLGLRVGDLLQAALDDNTRNRILGYMDPESLIVVLGFSGWERRMMQLLESWALTSADTSIDHKDRIIWLHVEPTSPPCEQMKERLRGRGVSPEKAIVMSRIQDADTFLASCYFRFSSAYPVSATAYEYLVPARIGSHKISSTLKKSFVTVFTDSSSDLNYERVPQKAKQRRLYHAHAKKTWSKYHSSSGTINNGISLHAATSSSVRMAAFALSLRNSHTTIWIDLEPHHTVQGVVCEIFNRMRVFDPELPTIHFPASAFLEPQVSGEEVEAEFKKARERIIEAMTRRSYILCFDRLEGFARPQTVHHGTPSGTESDPGESEQLGQLCDFLYELCNDYDECATVGNGRIAFSVDIPRARHVSFDPSVLIPPTPWERCYSQISHFYWRIFTKWQNQCIETESIVDERADVSARLRESLHKDERQLTGIELAKEIINIPCLASTIRNLGGASITHGEPPRAVDVFAVLSLLRRPKSLVTIRSVVGTHIARLDGRHNLADERRLRLTFEQLDGVVSQLTSLGLAYCLEGETIWFPSMLHEAAYKNLTERVRERRIASFLDAPARDFNPVDAIKLLLELLALIYWHKRYARHFYSGVYLPTQDSSSLWEYCYHRVSALRYLVSAHAMILRFAEVPVETWQAPECDLALNEFHDLLGTLGIRQSAVQNNAPSVGCVFWLELAAEIGRSRARQILAFRETLSREREHLFSAVPPETLTGWCRQLRDRDASAISGERLCAYLANDRFCSDLYKKTSEEHCFRPSSVTNAVKQLANELTELLSIATFLRRDYERSHRVVWQSNETVGDEAAKGIAVALGIRLKRKHSTPFTVMQIYEQAEKAIKVRIKKNKNELSDEQSSQLIENAWQSDGVKTWFAAMQKSTPKRLSSAISRIVSAMRRSAVSQSHLGEISFGRILLDAAERITDETIKLFEKNRLVGDDFTNNTEVQELSKQKLSNIRRRLDVLLIRLPLWGAFDNMLTERPAFGRLQFDVLLCKVQRHAQMLEEFARESTAISQSDYFEYRCDSILMSARAECLQSHFINCHRLLDRATAGLSRTPRHLVLHAIAEMYRAEACALSAASKLAGTEKLNTADRHSMREIVSHARDLLRRADEALLRAEGSLAGGRRDLSRWIDLFVGRSQIAFEWLLLEVSCFDTVDAWNVDWEFDKFTASIERRLEKALTALRSALDTIPYRKNIAFDDAKRQPQHQHEIKVLALWCQILIAGDFVLRLGRVKAAGKAFPVKGSLVSPRQWASDFGQLNVAFTEKDRLDSYLDFFSEICNSSRFGTFAELLTDAQGRQYTGIRAKLTQIREIISDQGRRNSGELLRTQLLHEMHEFIKITLPILWENRHGSKRGSR